MDLELSMDITYGRSKAPTMPEETPLWSWSQASPCLMSYGSKLFWEIPWASGSIIEKTLQTLQCNNVNPLKALVCPSPACTINQVSP